MQSVPVVRHVCGKYPLLPPSYFFEFESGPFAVQVTVPKFNHHTELIWDFSAG